MKVSKNDNTFGGKTDVAVSVDTIDDRANMKLETD